MKFAEVDYRTIDPRTGGIVAYLFDSWRCVATGTGTCDGNREVIEWKWSAGGQGTSVRTTEKVGENAWWSRRSTLCRTVPQWRTES